MVNPHATGTMNPAAFAPGGEKLKLTWIAPQAWKEKKGSGMRTVTFSVTHGDQSTECIIIQLPGSGGGLVSNVKRWMQQLNMIIPPETQFQEFLAGQQRFTSSGGLNGTLVDFTTLLSGDITSNKSGLASVIPAGEHTVFVAMFGARKLLTNQRHNFLLLCRSLRIAD